VGAAFEPALVEGADHAAFSRRRLESACSTDERARLSRVSAASTRASASHWRGARPAAGGRPRCSDRTSVRANHRPLTYAAYAGQSACNTPDTFFLAQDPDVYTALGVDDLRLTNAMAPFLTDSPGTVTNTAIAPSTVSAAGGTGTNVTAPDRVTAAKKLVEDTSGRQLYTGNLSAVAGKKHTFQVDVQRDAGTRDIRLTIGDSRTYANCTDMIVSLSTGTIGQITRQLHDVYLCDRERPEAR